MKKQIVKLFFLIYVAVAQAHTSRLAPETEHLSLAYGCVHVISGEFVQQSTDLLVGPSLAHSRIYDSNHSNIQSSVAYGFAWNLPRGIRQLEYYERKGRDDEGNHVPKRTTIILMEEREGASLIYHGQYIKAHPEEYRHYTVRPSVLKRGYTNYSPWGIDGTYSLHNLHLIHKGYQRRQNWGEFTVTLGCGTQRIYRCTGRDYYLWLLSKEIRPDGLRIFYDYDGYGVLHKAWMTGSDETTPLASYTLHYSDKTIVAEASNGQKVIYSKHPFKAKVDTDDGPWNWKVPRLSRADADHLIPTWYEYPKNCPQINHGKIITVNHPEGRMLSIGYHGSGQVHSLYQPSEKGRVCIATFSYANNYTDVNTPCREWTRYWINGQKRISHIQHFSKGQVHHQKQYYWGTEGKQTGNLVAKALCNPSGEALTSTYLVYDERGNILQEILCGNLSGLATPTHLLNQNGQPQGPLESYAIDRTYHPQFNVILTEVGSDGLLTEYQYHSGTNLPQYKIVGGGDLSHESFRYNQYALLTEHTTLSGPQHTLTEIQPITEPLHSAFGKPLRKWENYRDPKKGKQTLRSIHYQYDARGFPVQEDIYDAQNQHRYSIQRLFDPAGRVLEETNPLGQKTSHHYDANGNRTLTHFHDQEIQIEYSYDLCNRLTQEKETHPHATYTTSHRYDQVGRKIATVDPFQNQTLYEYNDLGRLVTLTHKTPDGQTRIEEFDYDLAGNKTMTKDALGHVTRTSYNSRNQPVCITYPDGSIQKYQYNGNGCLAKETAPNGVITITYNDPLMRPARKCYHDAEGNYLYDTQATFRGHSVSTETDANGIQTHYEYDAAGRLIETLKGTERTQLAYDSLGRQHKTTQWADEKTARITTRTYDNLDRVIEERIEDQAGTLFSEHHYGYDRHGNRCLEETQTSQGLCRTETAYDTRHRPICITDALGHITIISYQEDFAKGTTTATTTDPLSNQTITIQNSLGQVTQTERKDARGTLCAHTEYFYDLAGRKIRQCDQAIAEGFVPRTITTEWTYDSMGRVLTLTEAHGTPEQRETKHTYNKKGQKESTTLPDGTILHYLYDPLGRLQSYTASDQSFHYLYEYDLNSNLIRVTDKLTQTVTQRHYDPEQSHDQRNPRQRTYLRLHLRWLKQTLKGYPARSNQRSISLRCLPPQNR